MRPFYLILGHPRCGTGYMAKLFQAYGLDVGHEEMGEDGISCRSWATNDPAPPWAPGQRSHYISQIAKAGREIVTICAYRHPLDAIPSIVLNDMEDETRGYRAEYTLQILEAGPIDSACLSYLGWYCLIRALYPDQIIKVEEADKWIEAYMPLLERETLEPVPKNWNTRREDHENYPTRKEVLLALDPSLRAKIEFLCHRMKYDVPQAGVAIHTPQ